MKEQNAILEEIRTMAAHTRVFLSMPYLEGVSPQCLDHASTHPVASEVAEGIERREGYFALSEVGLSPIDHGGLYGDGVFEGIRVMNSRVVLLKEHIERWFHSAERIGLTFPYTREELTQIILEVSRQALGDGTEAYLRPVLTRGMGYLGVSPYKCIAPSLYIIAASVLLYPKQQYAEGIDIAIARCIRRNDVTHIDPNVKTCNYLNNVLAHLETHASGAVETLMLTNDGFLAEATTDNLFIAQYEDDVPTLIYPQASYALVGLTRNTVIRIAKRLGFETRESATLLPHDLIGPGKEVFITGTACGIMPIRSVDGLPTAPCNARPLSDKLRAAVQDAMLHDPNMGLSIHATPDEIKAYWAKNFAVSVDNLFWTIRF